MTRSSPRQIPAPIDTTKKYVPAKDQPEKNCEAGVYAASCSSIGVENLDQYLNRDDVVYIDLRDFKTKEIFGPVPNVSGNHGSSFVTPNTEYAMMASRFSIPIPKGTAVHRIQGRNFPQRVLVRSAMIPMIGSLIQSQILTQNIIAAQATNGSTATSV